MEKNDRQEQQQTQIENIRSAINKIDNNTMNVYFYVPNVKNIPLYSIKHVYDLAHSLEDSGYNVIMLYSDDEYTHPVWMGENKVNSLTHSNLDNPSLTFEPSDIVFVPETQTQFLEHLIKHNVSSKVVIVTNSYNRALDTLSPGVSWSDHNIVDMIVTNENMMKYFNKLLNQTMRISIVPLTIEEDYLTPPDYPREPTVAVLARDQHEYVNLIKRFYLRYPHFRWITFYDMRNYSHYEFIDKLKTSCLAVWVDPKSSYGTFPIECFETGTPLIAVQPEMPQQFITNGTAFWVPNTLNLDVYVYDFISHFVEDKLYTKKQLKDGTEKSLMDHFNQTQQFKNRHKYNETKKAISEYVHKLKEERKKLFEDYIQKSLIVQ